MPMPPPSAAAGRLLRYAAFAGDTDADAIASQMAEPPHS